MKCFIVRYFNNIFITHYGYYQTLSDVYLNMKGELNKPLPEIGPSLHIIYMKPKVGIKIARLRGRL